MSGSQTENQIEGRLEYVVMPDLGDSGSGFDGGSRVPGGGFAGRRRLVLLIVGGVIIIALVILLGYFLTRDTEPESVTPPAIVVDDGTPSPSSSDEDTDHDGLSNVEERTRGTDSGKPDSDMDGLADGDEIMVYGSDPMKADTDGDGYTDGAEVSRGYSPVTNASTQASDSERQIWQTKTARLGLHEPTLTTIGATPATPPPAQRPTLTYTNSYYNYSIEHDAELVVREERGGQTIGLDIAGVETGEDISDSMFVIQLAGVKDNVSLKEWAEAQYNANEYSLVELASTTMPAIQVSEIVGSECRKGLALFAKNNLVIGVTGFCNNSLQLEQYYIRIVNSFKFL